MIKEFQREYRWLSNFAPVKIILDDVEYPSVEHAYMSAKSNNKVWKSFCSNPNITAGQVKRESKNIELILGWNTIKLSVMEECIKQKFAQDPYKSKLLKTGNERIQEGNYWNDRFWGVCLKTNRGKNHLGRLIMNIRNTLKKS